MISQFLGLVLVNTYSWFGGQGYCAYDFALHERDSELTNLVLVLRPEYDPQRTASGNSHLEDVTINLESIGGARYNWDNTAKVETDCSVTGFLVVSATATEDGRPVDLIAGRRIAFETYQPLRLDLGKR